MLFNSYTFVVVFLPGTLFIYFFLNKRRLTVAAQLWLVFASLLFYSWWNIRYLPLILGSIIANFAIGTWLVKNTGVAGNNAGKKSILASGICANIALLGYFKYADFFIGNINWHAGLHLELLHIILPLGISFFTFTQIAYLVDAYKGAATEYHFLNYCLFVTFFPHLLAGPIIHHKEMMPQFARIKNKAINYRNLSSGILLFTIGLLKKVIIADTLAKCANNGFNASNTVTFLEAWATSLSYTFQLYFDFSGYTDMALGGALMFNIKLPENFNSPYKALDIRDFWKRWHITLGAFMMSYVYVPLGGNRLSEHRTLINIFITFLIGGFWHGAGWMFVLWGCLHGAATVIHRLWQKLELGMPRLLAWFLTFNFVNVAWVFFRANDIDVAANVLKGMAGMNGVVLPERLKPALFFLAHGGVQFGNWRKNIQVEVSVIFLLLFFMTISFVARNSNETVSAFKPSWINAAAAAILFSFALFNLNGTTEFIYFNF